MRMTGHDLLPAFSRVDKKIPFYGMVYLQAVMLVHGHGLAVVPAINTECLVRSINGKPMALVGYFVKNTGQLAIPNLKISGIVLHVQNIFGSMSKIVKWPVKVFS